MMASSIGFSITSSFDGGNIEVVSQNDLVISGRTAKLTVNVNVKPGEKLKLCSSDVSFFLSYQLQHNIDFMYVKNCNALQQYRCLH